MVLAIFLSHSRSGMVSIIAVCVIYLCGRFVHGRWWRYLLSVSGMIAADTENICEGFKDNREVQMFLTLYCWKYLCHSANIDFYTGADKANEIMN